MKKIVLVFAILLAILLYEDWFTQELRVHAAVNYNDIESVMNGLITQTQINQTNKPQFGNPAGSGESIDPASGKLVWERTDIHLPGRDGLDLDIGIMYDSNQAYNYMRQYSAPGLKKYNYFISRYDLGVGWSFKFPSIQMADGYLYYHTGNGAVYRIDYLVPDSHLSGYQGKDLKFMPDPVGLFNNGQSNSAYYLEYADKKKEYFASDGRLLGIVDRYGNAIIFEHIDRQMYDGQTYKVISKVTDTVGRTVHFDYETTVQTTGVFNGEQILVTVKDPAGVQSQQVTYRKWRSPDTLNGISDGYTPYLWEIKNQEGKSTFFNYQWGLAYFHYLYKSKDGREGSTNFLLLSLVNSPNSARNYEYDMVTRNFGIYGFSEEYRVKKRSDQLKKSALTGEYNVTNISYSGDYTGYPTYYDANNLPQAYTFSSNSTIQSSTPTNGLQFKSSFNGKGQLTSSETLASNGEKKITFNTAFHPAYIQKPTQVRYEEYGLGDTESTSNKLYKDIQYTDWGGIQSETNVLPLSDYNNSSIKSKHTISYTYDPTYYSLKTRSFYQSIGSASPSIETYDYYTNGRLKSYTNAQNETTSYCYDVLNENKTTSSNCSNATTAINGKVIKIKVSRPLGGGKIANQETDFTAATAFAYPSETRSYFTTKNSSGQNITNMVKKTMGYDMGTGLLKEETDSKNQKTQYQYDTMGRLTKVLYPNFTNSVGEKYAVVDEYSYIYASVPTSAVENNRGIKTIRVDYQRKYTQLSNNATTLLSRQSSYYNGFGSLLYELQNDNDGITQISQYEIDDLSRARKAWDPMNNTTTVTFDAWGNQREAIDAYGNLHISEYILKQRRNVSYFIAASNVSAYRGNPSLLSLRSNYIEQDFDNRGQLISNRAYKSWPTTSQPITELFSYDLSGNLVGYTDPKRNLNNESVTTRYNYDKLNRLISVKDALGQVWNYGYDGNNQITTMTVRNHETDAPQTLKNNSYTELGGIANKIDNFSNADTYRYDNMHMLEQRKDRKNTEFTYQYDAHFRIIQESAISSGKPTQQTKSVIGSNGILQDKIDLYKGEQLVSSMTTGIDTLKRVTSVTIQAPTSNYSSLLTLTYDKNNRITKNGSGAASTSFFTNYSYDKLRLDKVQVNGLSSINSADAANVKYEYYPNGNLKSITYPPLANGSILKTEYTYDALNRMTSVANRKGSTTLSSTTQTYDDNGNIDKIIEARYGETTTTTSYKYDKLNRLTTVIRPNGHTISYTYDTKGNRLTVNEVFNIESAAYEYDLYNKLTKVSKGDRIATFDYSPDGLRYKKTIDGTVKQYRYNQNKEVIAEVNGANQTIAHYVRGDRLLVKKDVAVAKDYYYLYNSHGDVIQIVDTNGDIKNSYKYDEWGNIVDQVETIDNDFKYSSEVYDEETGLYYLRARYYDPSVGRFINEDTYEGELNNPLSLNLYTYVHNNPLRYVDPSGHRAWIIHGTGSDPSTWSEEFIDYIDNDVFSEDAKSFLIAWNGGNTIEDRELAAKEWADFIYNWHSREGNEDEPVRLIGHSHGGNVGILIANLLGEKGMKVETLITIATPVREYQLTVEVGQHINVYNKYDKVQTVGGALDEGLLAERQFLGQAENFQVKLPFHRRALVTYGISNHSYMHSNVKVWEKYITPNIR